MITIYAGRTITATETPACVRYIVMDDDGGAFTLDLPPDTDPLGIIDAHAPASWVPAAPPVV